MYALLFEDAIDGTVEAPQLLLKFVGTVKLRVANDSGKNVKAKSATTKITTNGFEISPIGFIFLLAILPTGEFSFSSINNYGKTAIQSCNSCFNCAIFIWIYLINIKKI